jgi:hypothetical protein
VIAMSLEVVPLLEVGVGTETAFELGNLPIIPGGREPCLVLRLIFLWKFLPTARLHAHIMYVRDQ